MKRHITVLIVLIGFILFLMSINVTINDFFYHALLSIPYVGTIKNDFINIVILSWWQYVPLKPVAIVLMVILGVFLTFKISDGIARIHVERNKFTAAKKTMAHMVIKLDEMGNVLKNSGANKVVRVDEEEQKGKVSL